MGSTYWTTERIIEAILRWKKVNRRFPKSRDWWWSNSGIWPSFTTIAGKEGGWNGHIELARQREKDEK